MHEEIHGTSIKPSARVIIAYLALLLLSLAEPLLHHSRTNKVIEGLRPVIKLPDGSYVATLMPMPALLLRWLGQLSWGVMIAVFILFVLSFRNEKITRCSTICAVAVLQCAFTTFYAWYATFYLGFNLLH